MILKWNAGNRFFFDIIYSNNDNQFFFYALFWIAIRNAKSSIKCFVDRIQSCPDSPIVKTIKNAKLQADTFVDILCGNESTKLGRELISIIFSRPIINSFFFVRPEYMKSVPCLSKIRTQLDKCEHRVYQTIMLDVKANQKFSADQKGLINQCW